MLVSTHNLGSVPEFCDQVVLVTKCGLVWHTQKGRHFFDQDGVDLGRGGDQVHAAQDLHAQLVRPLAARQVLGTQFAQEGLEHVLQPGEIRRQLVGRFLVGQLEGLKQEAMLAGLVCGARFPDPCSRRPMLGDE